MGLRIKNRKQFIISSLILIFLLICMVVGFFTIMGRIIGLFKKEPSEPAPSGAAVTEVQPSSEDASSDDNGVREVDPSTQDSNLVLVNKKHVLTRDYEPSDLVVVSGDNALRGTRETKMRKEAAEALTKMFEAADKDGITLYCTSGYRSYTLQEEVYQENINMEGSEEKANEISAKPGESEHQTGLVMDVTSESVNMDLVEGFIDTPEGQWVRDHCHEYGFIVRFLKGKEAVTGYHYEPWHLRYVGLEPAAEMHEKNLTLEEYLKQLS